MARFTRAYSAFLERLDEVEELRLLAATSERENPVANRRQTNAACRGGIVLLSAHLEAYIKELGETALDAIVAKGVDRSIIEPRFFFNVSKSMIHEIKDTENQDKIATKVFEFLATDANYWEQSGPFRNTISAEKFNKGFSNPTHKKICSYFNRFGYSEFNAELNSLLTSRSLITVNMINHLVDVRNKVAHGDQSISKTPAEFRVMVNLIKNYCRTTDRAFSSWCKRRFCTIRS